MLALKLERFGCEALALVPRDLDLEANRYQSCERYVLSVLSVARGSPAVSICFELRVSWVVMGISTGVHVHLCVRVRYACVKYLYGAWACCVLPTGQGVRPELIMELVCYISHVYVPYGVRLE